MSLDLTLGELLKWRQPFKLGRIHIVFTPEGWAVPTYGQFPSGAAVLPVLGDGRVVLVEENRFFEDGTSRPVWNLLRGGRDSNDEPDEIAAIREGYEEAGITIPYHRLVDLGVWHPDQGMSPTAARYFAAVLHGLDLPTDMRGTDGETLRVKAFKPDEIAAMALNGQLADLNVPAMLWVWQAKCRKEGWTTSGTCNVSVSMRRSRVSQEMVDAWEAFAKAYPHAHFESTADNVRFWATWVPLDPPVPGAPPLPKMLPGA